MAMQSLHDNLIRRAAPWRAKLVHRVSEPATLWVGMTAPKQEKWIHQNLHRLDVRFAAAIGAVFDFYTGELRDLKAQGKRG